jgi:hypothetical protein
MKIDKKLLLVNLVVESCRFMQNRHRLQISSPRLTQKLAIPSCLLVKLHRNPYRTLLQLVDMARTPISMSSRLTTTLATNYSGQSKEPFRSNCHCKTLTQSGNRILARPLLHASEPLTARLTNMATTSGADYDSTKRQSETADRFNFSQVKSFRVGARKVSGCRYIYRIALDSLQSTHKNVYVEPSDSSPGVY